MTTTTKLSLIQQRDMLKQLLANVEAQIAPEKAAAAVGVPAELSFEETIAYQKKVDQAEPLISVEIDREGRATVTGLGYSDLRDIVTAASLHAYGDKFKPELVVDGDPLADLKKANGRESHRWYLRRRLLIDWLDDAVMEGLDEHNHKFHGSPRYSRARRGRAPRVDAASTTGAGAV